MDSIQKMVVLLMDHHVAKAQLQKAERALHDAQAATGTKQIQSTPSKRPA